MKALLAGFGVMGQKHFEALSKSNLVTSITTVDPVNPRAEYKLLDVALREKYDFSIVAVPTSLHEQVTLKIVNSGIDVLLEKPISKTTESANKISQAAIKKSVKVCIGHVERFNPVIQLLKEKIVGHDIVSITFERVGPRPTRITDVGVSLDLSIHDLDLVEYITNQQVTQINKLSSYKDGHKEYHLRVGDSTAVKITSSWLFPFRRRQIGILTNKNYYEVDLIDRCAYEYTPVNNISYNTKKLWVQNLDPLSSQLNSFIRYISGDKIGDLCDCQTAERVLSWI